MSVISRSLREAAQTSAAVPSGPAMTFCGMPFSKDCTAARSPALAAVTSGTLLWLTVSAASAAPARIEELSRPASTMVHLFIGVLPHMSVLVERSDKVCDCSVRLTACYNCSLDLPVAVERKPVDQQSPAQALPRFPSIRVRRMSRKELEPVRSLRL